MPGFTAAVYASIGPRDATSSGTAQTLKARGWTQLAPTRAIADRTTIAINSSRLAYRYYLVWITKLPPSRQTAEISEVTLFK
jgi:hypothetical protein